MSDALMGLAGKVTVNTDPTFFSLLTVIMPPISSQYSFATASPSPLPPLPVEDESSQANALNTWGRKSLSIPIPVSDTVKLSV